MWLLIAKALISFIVVILLATLSKRVNPVLGGLLSGLPLGTGLSVYFISSARGVEYMVQGIPWGIAGLSSSILFCLSYLLVGRLPNGKLVSMLTCSIVSSLIFLLSGIGFHTLQFSLAGAIVIFLAFSIANIFIIRHLKITFEISPVKGDTLLSLLLRGLVVGLIIMFITGVGATAGSKWAGILSSFPSTLFALILILHCEDGNRVYPAVLLGFSYGVSILFMFYLLCLWLLPVLGLNVGFVVVYLFCFLYLFIFNKLKVRVERCLNKSFKKFS